MNAKQKSFLFIAIGALILQAILGFAVLKPAFDQVSVVSSQAKSLDKQKTLQTKQLKQLIGLQANKANLDAEQNTIRTSIPSDASQQSFMDEVSAAGSANGVKISQVTWNSTAVPYKTAASGKAQFTGQNATKLRSSLAAAKSSNLKGYPVQITATGNQQNLVKAVAAFQNMDRIFIPTQTSMSSTSDSTGAGTSVSLSGYVFQLAN